MPLPKENSCTYADYAAWGTEDKYELFDGVPVMQARPSIAHQRMESQLLHQLVSFLNGKPCEAYAEIEVLLPDSPRQNADDVRNVFVPDIAVVCEPEKLTKQYCLGAPTVVMEILSPATSKIDRFVKLNAYQNAGVPEYWIVSPGENTITVFELHSNLYTTRAVYNQKDTEAEVFSLPGCKIDLTTVFQEEDGF